MAGYTATEERATCTCIGDTVNLAARLEAHTKAAGRDILVDGAAQAALGDRVPVESKGRVQFKGKGSGGLGVRGQRAGAEVKQTLQLAGA